MKDLMQTGLLRHQTMIQKQTSAVASVGLANEEVSTQEGAILALVHGRITRECLE